MSAHRCPECGWTYEEELGAPREGFPPGTPWSAVPPELPCPDCGVEIAEEFEVLA